MTLLSYACKNKTGSSWSISADRIDRALLERQVRIGATEMKIKIGNASMICSVDDLRTALADAEGPSRLVRITRISVIVLFLIALGAGAGAVGMMIYLGQTATVAVTSRSQAVVPAPTPIPVVPPSRQEAPATPPHPQVVIPQGPTAWATEAYWRQVNTICTEAMDRVTQIAANTQQSSVYDSPQIKQIKGFLAMATIRPAVQQTATQIQSLNTNGVASCIVETAKARANNIIRIMDLMIQLGNECSANPNMNDEEGKAILLKWAASTKQSMDSYTEKRNAAFKKVRQSLGLDLSPMEEKNPD